jgi:glycosyltransferase involved in cell wall biosynthesis
MKIMTSMYTLKKGGSYDRFLMMVEAFLERECEVHCLSLTPIRIRHPFYHNHVVAFPSRMKNGLFVKLVVLFIFPMCLLLAGWRERIDLFIAFGPLYAFLEALPKRILRKPMVTLIRLDISLGFNAKDLLDPVTFLNRVIEYIGLIFSNRIITTNKASKEETMKVIGRWEKMEIEILWNNIPEIRTPSLEDIVQTRKFLGIPDEAKILVTAGVLTPRKNIGILLRSLSKIGRNDFFLVIVGDSTQEEGLRYRHSLEALIQKLGLTRNVIITHWVGKEELWKILGASDLFVLASLREGMPNVILEALGLGLPCMGSDIAGVRDVLQYQELLFDPQDEVSLANKVWQFFSDAQFFEKVNRLCQERKQLFRFDWKERVFEGVTRGFTEERGDGSTLRPKS